MNKVELKEYYSKEQVEKRIAEAPYKLVAVDDFGKEQDVAHGEWEDMEIIKSVSKPGAKIVENTI